jgi:hypothetical protein
MVFHIRKLRSGPIHIQTPRATISLVEEAVERSFDLGPTNVRLSFLRPSGLFVIDDAGVRRLGFPNPQARALAAMSLTLLLAPLQYWWFARRNKSHGQR